MRVAVVTGVARCAGIGHAICTTFLESGLAVIGLDQQPVESSSPLLKYQNFQARTASVLDPKGVHEAISSALADLAAAPHTISVVVNNAGISTPYMQSAATSSSYNSTSQQQADSLHNLTNRLEEFDRYIQTNLRGAFLVTEVCKEWFPSPAQNANNKQESNASDHMVSVIHISSTRAHQSEVQGQEGYASAKAGLLGLMHSQGQALEGRARVNVVSPGWINTEQDYIPTKEDKDWHASGRVGVPDDVSSLVLFLSDNEKSGFVTCQEFIVDGGVSRKMYYPE